MNNFQNATIKCCDDTDIFKQFTFANFINYKFHKVYVSLQFDHPSRNLDENSKPIKMINIVKY